LSQSASSQQPPSPQEQIRLEQQRQEAERRAAEARRREEEAQRRQATNQIFSLGVSDLLKTAPRLATESCLTEVLPRDGDVDLTDIPFEEWLSEDESTQIPWRVQTGRAQLRYDQRYEILQTATIQGNELRWASGAHELVYVVGVSRPDGSQVIPPISGKQKFDVSEGQTFQARFSDCLFVQPGEYVVWSIVLDPETGRRNVSKNRVRASEFSSEFVPQLNSRLPTAEFPKVAGGRRAALELRPGPLYLPIANKMPVELELISIKTPADQWGERADIVRGTDNRVLAAMGVLTQARLATGSISVATLDLENRRASFQQSDVQELDWEKLAAALTPNEQTHKVSLPMLESTRQRSAFLRGYLQERLEKPGQALRVFVLISGSVVFERGSDVSAVKAPPKCNCRVYHLRLRAARDDVFDDLQKITRPLRPTRFDVMSAEEFRKTVGRIAQDLESLSSP
jgi:hypothetical protein